MFQKNLTLEQLLQRHNKRRKLSQRLIVFGIVAFIVLIFFANSDKYLLASMLAIIALFFLVMPYITVCLIVYIWALISTGRLQRMLDEEFIPSMIRDVLGECTYERHGRISDELLRATSPFPSDVIDVFSGNDLITGTYKGMNFSLCDLRVSSHRQVKDDEAPGGYRDVYSQVFYGSWMVIQTNLRPDDDVLVWEFSADEAFVMSNPVLTESIAFNERFQLGGDPLTVFKLITPPMIERLLAADRADRGAVTRVRYCPDGLVGITLDTGRDALEVSRRIFKDEADLKEQLAGDIRLILDVVDALELKGEDTSV